MEWRKTIDVTGLGADEIADIAAHVRSQRDGSQTYNAPRHGWTCFHCGETFHTEVGARLHFGETPQAMPECLAIHALR